MKNKKEIIERTKRIYTQISNLSIDIPHTPRGYLLKQNLLLIKAVEYIEKGDPYNNSKEYVSMLQHKEGKELVDILKNYGYAKLASDTDEIRKTIAQLLYEATKRRKQ